MSRPIARIDSIILVAIVRDNPGYQYSDKCHYNSAAYLDLGKQFANAWAGLRKQ